MKKENLIAIVFLFTPVMINAQHTTQHKNIIWANYINIIKFDKKWTLVSDAQARTTDWANKWLLYAVRSELNYNITAHLAVGAGFTLFRSAQYKDKNYFFKNEWRPFEDITYNVLINKTIFFQRMRGEQRFLQQVANNYPINKYQYIFRLRYRLDWQFPLRKNLKLLLGNEVFVNPGYLSNSLFFDQNRAFAGLGLKLSAHSILQTQYIKIFQWRSTTSVLEDQNVIRINFVQQFNLKKT